MLDSQPLSKPEKIELERLLAEKQRRKARDCFTQYMHRTFADYRPNWSHLEIAETLEHVVRGDLPRVIFVEPPRHGKSLHCSERFPAWVLGRNPKFKFIAAAYTGKLSFGFGRTLRNLMASTAHLDVFPNSALAPDSKAKDLWHTSQGGGYLASSVDGTMTGFGMNGGLIDDPFKGRVEAQSEHMRDLVWNWYLSDFYTRREPYWVNGKKHHPWIVLIQTAWHDDDLRGRLLHEESNGGDKWHVVHHPAIIDENGPNERALWEEQHSLDDLKRTRGVMSPQVWRALMQGDPTPEDGTYFTRDMLLEFDSPAALPQHLNIYAASDYAVTDDGGDYTVHMVVGVDETGRIWILDMWRQQASSDAWVVAMRKLVQQYGPKAWAEEAGQIEKGVGPFLTRELMEHAAHVRRIPYVSSTDKPTRARSIQGFMERHMVMFPAYHPLYEALKNELLKFPMGRTDDMVDTLSLIGRMLHGMMKAQIPPQQREMHDFVIATNEELGLGGQQPQTATYNDMHAILERAKRKRRR